MTALERETRRLLAARGLRLRHRKGAAYRVEDARTGKVLAGDGYTLTLRQAREVWD